MATSLNLGNFHQPLLWDRRWRALPATLRGCKLRFETVFPAPMANAKTVESHSGWRGHIWAFALSAIAGSLAPYFFGAAHALRYGLDRLAGEQAAFYPSLAISLGEFFQVALAPLFWFGIALWFVGCTAQLRLRRLAWPAWSIWGAVTLAAGYVLGVLVLFPKSVAGRLAPLVSDPLSLDAAAGVVASAVLGAILGALLFALSPKWPGSAPRSSESN